ncbi:D-alanyl-D-alanine carboxypeptidase family protein, partial [Sulfitobacter sp. HI0021]
MKARRIQPARYGLFLFAALWVLVILPLSAMAAPYAAYVIDARTGKEIHAENADTRLHPASLTKMMTLYIAFQAVERGELSLDTQVTISKNAASEPPSKLGMRPGQKIALRYLIRAAAVKSANDAATAIGEAIEGSEAAFARRMNRTAKQLGMTRTTFKNMHGLTESGHLSTARDMTALGRHLLYDYPQYYNLFSRITADAGVRKVSHTNHRFLGSYKGADGIKTGYTRAAGFNLTASAERGNERIIVTVFGGKSTASRNAKVAELMDLGFRRAPSSAPLRKPVPPVYADVEDTPA